MSKHKKPAKPAAYKSELTAYYNEVEEAVVALFGSFEKAAEWFDNDSTSLNCLWAYCEEQYVIGWSATRAANEWFNQFVAAQPIVKEPKSALEAARAPAPAAPATVVPATVPSTRYVTYYERPEVAPGVRIARAARELLWENSHLS